MDKNKCKINLFQKIEDNLSYSKRFIKNEYEKMTKLKQILIILKN